MALTRITIDGILGGRAPARFYPGKGQFTASVGVDPDLPVFGAQSSGLAVPSGSERVGESYGMEDDEWVVAIVTTPKDNYYWAMTSNGRLLRSTSFALDDFELVEDTGTACEGFAYYNNYLYVVQPTNVARYGPLDGAPSMASAFWTGTLGLAALNASQLPRFRGARYPSHPTLVHSDGCLYFGDVKDGQGILNKISTMSSGGVEGSVNSTAAPSAYNALDLPFNCRVTSLASYSTSIAVGSLQTSAVEDQYQGQSFVFFWDAVADSFDQQVAVPDQWCTALCVRYGRLTAFTGSFSSFRVSEYVGGSTFEELAFVDGAQPPTHYGTDVAGRRVVWGSWAADPDVGSLWALGSRASGSQYDLQNAVPVGPVGLDGCVTAVRYMRQEEGKDAQYAMGLMCSDDEKAGIYRRATQLFAGGDGANVLRSPVVTVNRKFRFDRVRVPFVAPVAATARLKVTLVTDEQTEVELQEVTSANVGATRYRTYKAPEAITPFGWHDFRIDFEWLPNEEGTTAPTPVAFPVECWVEPYADEDLYEAPE